jgi:hypothetical protein
MRRINATVLVTGDPAALEGFRRQLNALFDAGPRTPYRELHAAGRLDYRIRAEGVPYPQIVAASDEFPELEIDVAWESGAGAATGRARIRAGLLVEQGGDLVAASGLPCALRVERDGALAIGLACRQRAADDWIGYVVTASRHALFRLAAGSGSEVLTATEGVEPRWAERWTIRGEAAEHARVAPPEPVEAGLLEALDQIAAEFAEEWIWFDAAPAVETAIERERHAAYGFPVAPANVRAGRLKAQVPEAPAGGWVLEPADPAARRVALLVARLWLPAERP